MFYRKKLLVNFTLSALILCLSCSAYGFSVMTFPWDTKIVDTGKTTFGFTSGDTRAAQAEFEISGSNLMITLKNISSYDVVVPEENLTTLFFDLAGSPTLGAVDALLGPGAVVYQGATIITVPGGDVSGEWAYKMNVPTVPAAYTISSVGLDDLIGPKDRFDTTMNLAGPDSPDGMQYGIVSTGDIATTGNGGIMSNPLIRDSVVFTLSDLPNDFELDAVSNVWFHYGTSFYPPSPPQEQMTPEPITAVALLLGMGGLTNYVRRRIR